MSTDAVTLDPRRISRLALFVHKSKALPLLLLLPLVGQKVAVPVLAAAVVLVASADHGPSSSRTLCQL